MRGGMTFDEARLYLERMLMEAAGSPDGKLQPLRVVAFAEASPFSAQLKDALYRLADGDFTFRKTYSGFHANMPGELGALTGGWVNAFTFLHTLSVHVRRGRKA